MQETSGVPLEGTVGDVVVLAGWYGSGKTEIALNLAVHLHRRGIKVKIFDLDTIKWYFRVRDAKGRLPEGIEVIAPPENVWKLDLPIVPRGTLEPEPGVKVIVDLGGTVNGARALASLSPLPDMDLLLVLNPFRIYGDVGEDISGTVAKVEALLGKRFTGIVANGNLADETSVREFEEGLKFAIDWSGRLRLPVKFACAPEDIVGEIRSPVPVLPIRRFQKIL